MPSESTFATAVNCMDGRVQEPVAAFARKQFGVDYVDMVTEAGPVADINASVLRDVSISVVAHDSCGIVVAAHSDCAGNPVADEMQQTQCLAAVDLLRKEYAQLEVVPVWVNAAGEVAVLSA